MRVEQALVVSIEEARCRSDVAEASDADDRDAGDLESRPPVERSRKNADSASPSSTIQRAARPIDIRSNSTRPVTSVPVTEPMMLAK